MIYKGYSAIVLAFTSIHAMGPLEDLSNFLKKSRHQDVMSIAPTPLFGQGLQKILAAAENATKAFLATANPYNASLLLAYPPSLQPVSPVSINSFIILPVKKEPETPKTQAALPIAPALEKQLTQGIEHKIIAESALQPTKSTAQQQAYRPAVNASVSYKAIKGTKDTSKRKEKPYARKSKKNIYKEYYANKTTNFNDVLNSIQTKILDNVRECIVQCPSLNSNEWRIIMDTVHSKTIRSKKAFMSILLAARYRQLEQMNRLPTCPVERNLYKIVSWYNPKTCDALEKALEAINQAWNPAPEVSQKESATVCTKERCCNLNMHTDVYCKEPAEVLLNMQKRSAKRRDHIAALLTELTKKIKYAYKKKFSVIGW